MIVEYADKTDLEAWNAYVDSSASGSFYHRYEWRGVFEESVGHDCYYIMARSNTNEVVGVLPLVHLRSRLFGSILCSLPFLNYAGVCATEVGAQAVLIEEAQALAERLQVNYLELRSATALQTAMPSSTSKVSMTIDLVADAEVLWNGFASKHRTAVRRAAKNGLEVSRGGPELLESFYTVMAESWRDLGTPFYHRGFFRSITDAFGSDIDVFVCRKEGRDVAVAMNGAGNGIVEGMWAGMSGSGRKLMANYVLYWEMIRDACERGFSTYHLGRSTQGSGAEWFKKKWRAQSQQLNWYYHPVRSNAMPALNVDNPKYALAIRAWRHIPVAVASVVGPGIAKSIP